MHSWVTFIGVWHQDDISCAGSVGLLGQQVPDKSFHEAPHAMPFILGQGAGGRDMSVKRGYAQLGHVAMG